MLNFLFEDRAECLNKKNVTSPTKLGLQTMLGPIMHEPIFQGLRSSQKSIPDKVKNRAS